MVKTVSPPSSLLAVLVAGVIALGVVWLLHLGHVEASSHSATRSFAPPSVPAGGELEVTITASNYGGFWGVEETLPGGFTYVEGSVAPSDVRARVDGLTVSFTLLGGESLAYSSWPVCNSQAHRCPWDEAQDALRPRCPAEEAINSNRRTVPSRRKGLSLQPPDEAANEGLNHSVHQPALRAKGLSLPIGSVP